MYTMIYLAITLYSSTELFCHAAYIREVYLEVNGRGPWEIVTSAIFDLRISK